MLGTQSPTSPTNPLPRALPLQTDSKSTEPEITVYDFRCSGLGLPSVKPTRLHQAWTPFVEMCHFTADKTHLFEQILEVSRR